MAISTKECQIKEKEDKGPLSELQRNFKVTVNDRPKQYSVYCAFLYLKRNFLLTSGFSG